MGNMTQLTGDVFKDLAIMHEKFGFYDKPFTFTGLIQRLDFIREELVETYQAADEGRPEEVLDGLIDIIVVAVGTIDLSKAMGRQAWLEVMQKNCAKEVGHNDKRPNTEGLDLIKPEGWTPPYLDHFVGHLHAIVTQHYRSDFKLDKNQLQKDIVNDIYSNESKDTYKREAFNALEEIKELVFKKSQDYASNTSGIEDADYYPFGLISIYQMIHTKQLRIRSIIAKMLAGGEPNFEDIESSMVDLIAYTSFGVEWNRRKMQGQRADRDLFNRTIKDK